jgi:putative transposase
VLKEAGIRISMEGQGRVMDNIFVERLWRSVKYEAVELKDEQAVSEAVQGLERYFPFYHPERPPPSFDGWAPAEMDGLATPPGSRAN